MLAYPLNLFLEMRDTAADVAAIHFKLSFTRTTQTHATAATPRTAAACLSCQMRPGAGETGKTIFILRQFNLKCAFAGAGVLGKNIENERRPVKQFHILTKMLRKLTL